MDRALASEAKGCGFDPRRAHHKHANLICSTGITILVALPTINSPNQALAPVSLDAFSSGEGMQNIRTLVALTQGTCTYRAAMQYLLLSQQPIKLVTEQTFERAIQRVQQDRHTAILAPHLHECHTQLSQAPNIQHIESQDFHLPNPGLFLATPRRNGSSRTYLWSLPTLVPLVEEICPIDEFEEVVPAANTQSAAEYCSRIFGGAFCVTNERGVQLFDLEKVHELRQITMLWSLFRSKPKP
jgi:hypothetical protein